MCWGSALQCAAVVGTGPRNSTARKSLVCLDHMGGHHGPWPESAPVGIQSCDQVVHIYYRKGDSAFVMAALHSLVTGAGSDATII